MRSKFPRWGLSVLTMASVATLVLLVTGWGSALASSVSSVIVANTTSNPANVHEAGTANVKVTNTTPVPVQETNTDTNGNIKVHEQGTANVSVTGTPTVQTDGATVIANGSTQVAQGSGINLSGGTESGDARFTDVSAYRDVTLFLRLGCQGGPSDLSSTDVPAFTGNPQSGFLLPQQFDSIVPTSEFSVHTFSPAPATIWLNFDNNSPDQCTVEYVLVGRNN